MFNFIEIIVSVDGLEKSNNVCPSVYHLVYMCLSVVLDTDIYICTDIKLGLSHQLFT